MIEERKEDILKYKASKKLEINVKEISVVRNKFRGDNYISNIILAELFLAKYPAYSCKIKKSKNHISQKSCGCC
jgi:hypothetical protein